MDVGLTRKWQLCQIVRQFSPSFLSVSWRKRKKLVFFLLACDPLQTIIHLALTYNPYLRTYKLLLSTIFHEIFLRHFLCLIDYVGFCIGRNFGANLVHRLNSPFYDSRLTSVSIKSWYLNHPYAVHYAFGSTHSGGCETNNSLHSSQSFDFLRHLPCLSTCYQTNKVSQQLHGLIYFCYLITYYPYPSSGKTCNNWVWASVLFYPWKRDFFVISRMLFLRGEWCEIEKLLGMGEISVVRAKRVWKGPKPWIFIYFIQIAYTFYPIWMALVLKCWKNQKTNARLRFMVGATESC